MLSSAREHHCQSVAVKSRVGDDAYLCVEFKTSREGEFYDLDGGPGPELRWAGDVFRAKCQESGYWPADH